MHWQDLIAVAVMMLLIFATGVGLLWVRDRFQKKQKRDMKFYVPLLTKEDCVRAEVEYARLDLERERGVPIPTDSHDA